MKRRLSQFPAQMSIMQAFKPKGDSSISKIQSIQEESNNQSKQMRPGTNSNKTYEKSHKSTTDIAPDVSNVVSASPAPFCEILPFFDIGTLDFTTRLARTDSQKLDALTSRFKPLKGWKAPLLGIGKKSRRAPDFVFDESLYPCLRYSPSLGGAFCALCTVFNSTDNILVARPLTD